jgi:hypothetical protein
VSLKESEYKPVSSHSNLEFGVQVSISGIELTVSELTIVSSMCSDIYERIQSERARKDQQAKAAGDECVRSLLACFDKMLIYVERIPNGYCSKWCCAHIPWLVVTTRFGRITVGWRKRVISIDWSQSDIKSMATEIFPNEDVTKEGQMIHAWGYKKAKQYINRLSEVAAFQENQR